VGREPCKSESLGFQSARCPQSIRLVFSFAGPAIKSRVTPSASPPKGHQLHGIAAPEFGQNVGAEQPAGHTETSRTGIGARSGSSSMSRCGEACITTIRAAPVGSRLSRRDSARHWPDFVMRARRRGFAGDFTILVMPTSICKYSVPVDRPDMHVHAPTLPMLILTFE
jgi:hypothetical protein